MYAACTMLSTFLPVILPAAVVVPPASALHHMRMAHPARQAHMLKDYRPQRYQPQGSSDHHLEEQSRPLDHASSGGGGSSVPLVVTNQCREDIYPGILSQSGQGPQSSGFRLGPGDQRRQQVSHDWQGRVWGRTNCSFNQQDDLQGVIPVTLAEFTLNANGQTFYDISLVDGYNLPMGVVSLYPSSGNSTLEAIPPNLTNPVCIGTASELAPPGSTADSMLGTNESFPLPLEESLTASEVAQWCPWSLQLNVPRGSQSGVYTYPEGALQRPLFDPCYSQCAKTGQPQDCCTGRYQSPSVCKPSIYSADAKMVCPDAYSYAFDDQTSTFIIPASGGFEIIFCPPGRSTTILATYKQQLSQLAQGGLVVSTTNGRVGRREEDQYQATLDFGSFEKGEEVAYTVDGVEFRGTKVRHSPERFGDLQMARQVKDEL